MVLFILALATGVVLAAVTVWRMVQLERMSELRFQEVLDTRAKLEHLSAHLLSAQEDERRRISRELHGEVGQVLSAMMLGLGNLRSSLSKNPNSDPALHQVQLIEDMTERSARVVRNLSLILRPPMLDDLGLVAALKWLAREITRTGTLRVDVAAEDTADELPEEHRTCAYRVVQEALRNCSRHSGARHARIYLETDSGRLRVGVQDDGKGFDAHSEKETGILVMQERVKWLGGSFHLDSTEGCSAAVHFELPLPQAEGFSRPIQETSPFRTA